MTVFVTLVTLVACLIGYTIGGLSTSVFTAALIGYTIGGLFGYICGQARGIAKGQDAGNCG